MSKTVKNIVCFGGGNLIPQVLLEPLKKYPVKIFSVTSMTDNGGSTGQLRKDLGILPAGDISRHLVALSNAPQWKKDLFYLRFGRERFVGGHVGYRFGTLFISLTEYITKDFKKALEVASNFLELKKHKALPATINKVQLMAELEDGEIIKGEDEIDIPKRHNPKLRIKKLFLRPKAKIYLETKKAIMGADIIILGPGDLYSSVVPCLLPEGMKEVFKKTKAKKILICNTITKLGETNNFSVLDFTREIEKYIGCPLDFILYHNKKIRKETIKKCKKVIPLALNPVQINKNLPKTKFIGDDFLVKKGFPTFNSKKIINRIFKLCKL